MVFHCLPASIANMKKLAVSLLCSWSFQEVAILLPQLIGVDLLTDVCMKTFLFSLLLFLHPPPQFYQERFLFI